MTVRVLHVFGSAQRDWTGIVNVILQTLPLLAKRGYEADALFLGSDGPLAARLSSAGAGVALVRWHGGARDPLGALRFWRMLRKRRYDIVHTHIGGRLLLRLAGLATGSRVVFHVHSQVREVDGKFREDPIRAADADAVVAVSQSVANAISGARPIVVHSGIAIPPRPSPGARASSPPVIGAAGRLEDGKGFADLIRALPLIPDSVQLEIAGDGPERASLERLATELGVADRVTLLGWVPEMDRAFARWTVFAHPSRAEGFSAAILEAMAAELPIVATRVGGVPEAIIDGESGLLSTPGQPAQLAAAINRLLGDRSFADALGRGARERVSREFSVERQAGAIEQVYQSLLHTHGSAERRL